jgi:uncharacterized UBP type Zn finger protein
LSKPGKLAPAEKIRILMHKAKPSRGYNTGQHDVSEFIADFVEELDNEYEDSYTGISDLIRTDISEQLVCDKCKNATTNYLHVMVHALPVHEATLLEAWNTYLAPEIQAVRCNCGNETKTKTQKVVRKPKILALSYNRFESKTFVNSQGQEQQQTVKINHPVKTPLEFNLEDKRYRCFHISSSLNCS